VKGISYAPVPLKQAGSALPDDDFMSEGSATMWGPPGHGRGRRDLMIMKSLGANAVRLYGNDPALDHAAFMDAAEGAGLDVVAGLSDYPFVQMPGSCIQTGFDCFDQIKEQYGNNLKKGFIVNGSSYHKALKTVIIMNEPDLKFEGGLRGTPGPPEHFCRALISGLDGMISAEKELNVTGPAPNFTVAFSFGRCDLCSDKGNFPGIGQMLELRRYMKNPKLLNYTARNDMWLAYKTRFINSFNTANPAIDIRPLFLDEYDREFPQTPVFLGEYHSPNFGDQRTDLHRIMEIAANESTMLIGLSFFEFQKRYDKGGGEMTFGMFGLGERTLASTTIATRNYSTYCLETVEVKLPKTHDDFDPNQCGQQHEDVDFVVDGDWATHIDHVPTPADCCARCQEEHKRCDVWTWVKEAGLDGIPSQCWLKGGGQPRPTKKPGVVSSYMHGGAGGEAKKKAEKPHADHLHELLTEAFGGPGLEPHQLCPAAADAASGGQAPAAAAAHASGGEAPAPVAANASGGGKTPAGQPSAGHHPSSDAVVRRAAAETAGAAAPGTAPARAAASAASAALPAVGAGPVSHLRAGAGRTTTNSKTARAPAGAPTAARTPSSEKGGELESALARVAL